MIAQVFATKQKMTQVWTKSGKRLAVTCVQVVNNGILGEKPSRDGVPAKLEVAYGTKKLKNVTKPLRARLEKSGFSFGIDGIKEVVPTEGSTLKAGDVIKAEQVLQVGDIVKVQGTTKGRGFAGAMKRHGFSGGPKTHGQSDRWRAVGAIGQRTTPGRVFKGKRMPGHYGVDVQTVEGLTVLYVNPENQEVWLSGPVPGFTKGMVTISKTGQTKAIELDEKASGIKSAAPAPEAEAPATTTEGGAQ